IAHRRSLAIDGSIAPIAEHVVPHITLLDRDQPEYRNMYDAFLKVSAATYFEMWENFLDVHASVFERYRANNTPILLLSGDHDLIYPPVLSALVSSFLPCSRTLTVHQASNMVSIDQPAVSFDYIDRFIRNSDVHMRKPNVSDDFF